MIGYFRVKRFEMSIRASRRNHSAFASADDLQREVALRRNLEEVFGISVAFESARATTEPTTPHSASHWQQRRFLRSSETDRLENDLRDAGLL